MTRASLQSTSAASLPLQRAMAAVGCGVVAVCSFPSSSNVQPRSFAVAPSVQHRSSASAAVAPSAPLQVSKTAKLDCDSRNRIGCTVSACALLGGAAGGSRRRRQRFSWAAAASSNDAVEGASGSGPGADAPGAVEKDSGSRGKAGDGDIFSQLTSKWNSLPLETQEDLKTFFTSLTIALSFRAVFVEPRFIPSLSMYPTFDIGDQLTVDKISRRWRDFQRRDVVVFNPPPAFNEVVGGDRFGEALIKRIVAIEGDVVEVKNGGALYINGERQDEPFTNEAAAYRFGPVTVPQGCVFVLGDNRNQSLDGHVWGFLPKENIIGRATLKFWPPWRVGSVQASPP